MPPGSYPEVSALDFFCEKLAVFGLFGDTDGDTFAVNAACLLAKRQWVSLNPQVLLPPLKCRQDNPSNRLNCINSPSEPGHLLSCRIGEVWTEIFSSNSNSQCCENCAVATEDDEASRVKHVSYLFTFSGNAASLIVLPILARPKSTSAPSE
jgi:hypothetical protein